jgi:hypothetical protein
MKLLYTWNQSNLIYCFQGSFGSKINQSNCLYRIIVLLLLNRYKTISSFFSIMGYARISLLKSNEITELLIATVQMTENKLLHLQTPRVYQTPAAKRHPAIEGHKNHTG